MKRSASHYRFCAACHRSSGDQRLNRAAGGVSPPATRKRLLRSLDRTDPAGETPVPTGGSSGTAPMPYRRRPNAGAGRTTVTSVAGAAPWIGLK